MWEKSNESVIAAKKLAESLGGIWQDKEFIIRVLNALDGDIGKAKELICIIQDNNLCVPSQVYDELEVALSMDFESLYNKLAIEKRKFYQELDNTFAQALLTEKLYVVCEWNLSNEDEERFKTAEIGDTIQISSEPVPILLQDVDTGEIIIPVFTSELELKNEYRDENHCIQEVEWSYIKKLFNSVAKNMGEAVVLLDMDSNFSVELNEELLKENI